MKQTKKKYEAIRQPKKRKHSQLSKSQLGILLGVLVVLALGGLYLFRSYPVSRTRVEVDSEIQITQQEAQQAPSKVPQPTVGITQLPAIPSDWNTYMSPEYIIWHESDAPDVAPEPFHRQFSLRFPGSWQVIENSSINLYGKIVPLFTLQNGEKGIIFQFDGAPVGNYCPDEQSLKDFTSPLGILRRIESNATLENNQKGFYICTDEHQRNFFSYPSSIGRLSYNLPQTYIQSDLEEMDWIMSSLTRLK